MLITKEILQSLQPKQEIKGVILVKNYQVQLTKTNKEYIVGNMQSGIDIQFKAWSQTEAFKALKESAYENIPSLITATVDDYGGVLSLSVTNICAVEGYTPDQFFPIRYNIDAYWNALISQTKQKIQPKGFELLNTILFSNEKVAERFKTEFAAMHHHDNCKGGLLAHTYKVFSFMTTIISQYSALITREGEIDRDYVDLLYIGCILHDLGKIVEMNFGTYQPESIVTHNFLGVELINPYKEAIIGAYCNEWYYELVSILLQHHGEYGMPCKTLASYIIHKVDFLEATLTDVCQNIESIKSEKGAKIKVENSYLTI